jgi:hypothetical protein
VTLPTREQMKQIYAKLRKDPDQPTRRLLHKKDMEEMGLCVSDFMELPREVFDGTESGHPAFIKHEFDKWLGVKDKASAL